MMKHVMSAVVALAFGIGCAAAAPAQETPLPNTPAAGNSQSRVSNVNMPTSTSGPIRHVGMRAHIISRHQARHLQQTLRADGLYNGRIDGIMGPQTHMALARLHHQSPRIAKLHPRNPAVIQPNVGVGSSTPPKSGMSGDATATHVMPPAPLAPNAGGTAGAPDQKIKP